jgi:Na+-translocating ferredoxin:NAD+ oxidoreductase RnfG subunit
MEPKWLWIPVVTLGVAAPAAATVYLSVEQAQAQMFPGMALRADFRTLSDAQLLAIEKDGGLRPPTPNVQAWRAPDGGWFILDQVIGKHAPIRFAVALDAHGAVRDVEILEYLESYGAEIRLAAWRRQFRGKSDGDRVDLDRNIRNISGATLSCSHVTEGIRRVLATYAVALAHG